MQLRDITGQRFFELVALRFLGRNGRRTEWLCRCDCGTEKAVALGCLTSGKAMSCGCRRRRACAEMGRRTAAANSRAGGAKAGLTRTRHGRAREGSPDRTYMTWEAMRARCSNPGNVRYHRYGGRGIKVCARWDDFANFLADMGERPEGKTLDRIDCDGSYEPGNCRWATVAEQARNRSRNRRLEIDGRSLCVTDWAAAAGTKARTVCGRLDRGWDARSAVFGRSL